MEQHRIHRSRNRYKRAQSVRLKIRGSQARPRLCIMKSNRHIGAQLIDDQAGVTLLSVHSLMKQFRDQVKGRNKTVAKTLGAALAVQAQKQQITSVVFDRGHHRYHGIIAEFANAAREGGLQF